jgi:hypothetical protein
VEDRRSEHLLRIDGYKCANIYNADETAVLEACT